MIRALMLAGADAFRINMSHGDQARQDRAGRGDPRARKGVSPPDHDPVRPAGPQAARRQVQGRVGQLETGQDRSSSTATRRRATRPASSCRTPNCSTRSRPGARLLIDDGKIRLQGRSRSTTQDRRQGRGRRQGFRQQGRQRARCRGADPGADRKGPGRPGLRARAEGRLDRFVVRPAARGRRRSARTDRRARALDGQDRKAGGDRPAGRDHRSVPTG